MPGIVLGFKLGPAGDTGIAVPGALKVNFQVHQYKINRTYTVSMEINCVQTKLSIVHMPKIYICLRFIFILNYMHT
jgi:hypothetical protein